MYAAKGYKETELTAEVHEENDALCKAEFDGEDLKGCLAGVK